MLINLLQVNSRGDAVAATRVFALAWACGALSAVAMVVIAITQDLPLRDPDDDILPGYIRMPAIVLGAVALDIVPRVIHRARQRGIRHGAGWRDLLVEVRRERWGSAHLWFAMNGVLAWYLCYATFRNVKNMVPWVNPREWDSTFAEIDRFLFAGHDPAAVLHAWFGTGPAAHVLSAVYLLWIVLVPISIAVALVWTRHTSAGAWFVTAVAVDWCLGAAIYLMVPTVGPIYSDPGMFADLPDTFVHRLQDSMWADRVAVLADPWGTATLQSIAAFASLHVGIMVTICLFLRLVGWPAWVQASAWVFLALTVLSTIYLGWHFATDAIGGAALGAFAVWIAGVATGNRDGWRVRLVRSESTQSAVRPDRADASVVRRATR